MTKSPDEEHTLPIGRDGEILPIDEIYEQEGLTQVWDDELGWIIVNAEDLSKLWPKRRQFQFYYPPPDKPKP